ncbi:MAG TPA: hypothetical protein VG407_13160 [Caulobacteraceae bacterium]|jgi:hypothetical protein|nr:hypothetical protein [Caulobacteraceae bacterium]
MRGLIAGVLVAATAFVGAGAYAAGAGQPQREEGMICLETNGSESPSVCQRGDVWHDADLCTCKSGMRFKIPVCAPGQKPPPDSVAVDRARREAMKTGTLYGATYDGRPMCVDVHHPRSNGFSR